MKQKINVSKAKKELYAKQTCNGVRGNFCMGTKKSNCQFVVLWLESQSCQSVGALLNHLSLLPKFFLNEIKFPPFFKFFFKYIVIEADFKNAIVQYGYLHVIFYLFTH